MRQIPAAILTSVLPSWAATTFQAFERGHVKTTFPESHSDRYSWITTERRMSEAVDRLAPLDETPIDLAPGQPGLVRMRGGTDFIELAAQPDSRDGFVVEASRDRAQVVCFESGAIDYIMLEQNRPAEWAHVDRQKPDQSFAIYFEVDPAFEEVQRLAYPPTSQSVSVGPERVVIGGTALPVRQA